MRLGYIVWGVGWFLWGLILYWEFERGFWRVWSRGVLCFDLYLGRMGLVFLLFLD